MKKVIKKMKGKKVLSLVLAAIMIATTFNIAIPMLKLDANAATTIDGVTQERIVTDYATTYDNYAAQFLNGASSPTNIVIPGLNAAQDYVIQGMTYYPKRDWMLVTAYHNADTDNGETVQSSKVFALDAATGEFVAMFSFLNPDGTANTEHGGGIACSENNIYYACGDDDRQIAYAPISAFENATVGTHTVVQLVDMVEFNEVGSITSDSKTAYTAYVCYDDGVLWTGNFYDMGVKIIGISVAATDYSVPANNDYNSMVFGYRLSGNSSAEEWNNLMGSTGKDCRGNPSYVVGLNNSIKDVQYAVVDNGKLYLSCSFGTGEGTNSVSLGGMNPYSSLIVADIDLTQPGTKSTTITTHDGDKDVMAYDIEDYKSYNMMPMSEGLCVINDKVFITFESASNKYLNEAGTLTGNCNHPIDVIWELDPYELMETVVAEPEKSIYYEKVYSHADIVDGDEYIIVYESDVKDPVTQKNYLYALNANGNFKGYELSKTNNDATNIKGYDGMIGHPISYYSFEKGVNNEDILYLEHPEEDDIESIRWVLSRNSNESNTTKYSIKNTSPYFANYNSLYFDQSKIAMASNGAVDMLSNIKLGQLVTDSGGFVLSNADQFYLWCNDGSNAARNEKANAFYEANKETYPILDGVTETPGTFHCDALKLSGDNIIDASIDKGEAVSDQNERYREGVFQIYHRVVDEAASTYESRVYTDLEAELQEDGTYDVTLETFAISPNHYQYRGEEKPTDYIIVADTSSSMASTGSTGINEYTGSLSVSSMSIEANTSDDNGTGVSGYGFSNPDEDIYLKHTDGKYYKAYMAVNTTELKKVIGIISSMRQKYYVYYIADDGLYYCVEDHAVNPVGRTYSEWKAWVDSGENESDYSTKTSNSNRRKEDVYVGYHYRFDDVNSSFTGEHVRLDTLKTAVNDLVDDIAAQNSGNRIALVQYGADASSGFITASGVSTTDYANAFWPTGTVDQLKSKVTALATSEQTNNSGIEMDYVNALISNSGYSYKSDGTRNVAVIFFSDGIPGADANSATTSAANAVIGKALTAKNNGAFIYTALIGNNSVSGFNKKAYMDGVSSRYAAAASLTDLGGQSVDGVNYAISLATTTMNNFVNFGAMTTEEVAYNTSVGLDNLDANSYLRQQLNDAFKFPADFNKDTDLIVELITGEYDEIGRFSFNEADKNSNANDAATIKNASSVDTGEKILTVTKYDYADEYVARNRTDKDGRKLRVVLKGLLADESKKIQNTSINNTDTTGIFKTQDNMDNNVAFKYLPTSYFNIPEYTYVLDFGKQMYDYDVNGTLKSVSADLSAQRDADGNLAYKTESENGLVQITNNNLDLLYSTTPTNFSDSGYCLIQRDDGTYDWFEIKVVPGSNVLFEEDSIELADDTIWESKGTSDGTYQDLTNNEADVYGYDSTYASSTGFSNGTHYFAKVDANNKRSDTATFTFKGTSFDLIGACGKYTGIQVVQIDKKVYIVDTFCDDATLLDSNNLIYQVPIVNWTGAYGEHTVKVTAAYFSYANGAKTSFKNNKIDTGLEMSSAKFTDQQCAEALLESAGITDVSAEDVELIWFDDNSVLNGGTGVAAQKNGSKAQTDENGVKILNNYIDGFRVYNPLGNEVTENYDPYANYRDTEKYASYANVIENLADIEGSSTNFGGIAYTTGNLAEGETLTFANYESIGPENELYLKTGTSDTISFKFDRAANEKVMLALRAVNGATSANVNGTLIPVNSATEMYYDISDLITATGEVTVPITNGGSNILAVNHIKFSGVESSDGGTVISPRSMARSTDATEVITNKFLPITQEDLGVIESVMSAEPKLAEVRNGVVVPIVEEDVSGDNTNNDTNTEENEKESFSISSIIEMIIALIEKILKNAFGINTIA